VLHASRYSTTVHGYMSCTKVDWNKVSPDVEEYYRTTGV
jgi:hypothetical protein